jgi:hypothetical protein
MVVPLEFSGRDYAIFLLRIAAEVEHSLMVQYLFAAYTLGGPPPPSPQKRRRAIVDNEVERRHDGNHQFASFRLLAACVRPLPTPSRQRSDLGSRPEAITVNPDNGNAYVANGGEGTVTVIDPDRN